MEITGRKREQRELKRLCESGRPEFAVVYGRRRVGKTYLVREYSSNAFAFHVSGVAGGNAKVQLESFNDSLADLNSHGLPWWVAGCMIVRYYTVHAIQE